MTERLYYQEPALERFQARLLAHEPAGEGWQVVLDRTAFYPEGGGQPSDRGTLGAVRVTDVRLDGERILHIVSAPLELPEGTEVSAAVDPVRRLEFRQQHTGQHILSACLVEAAGARTVSSSLGERFTTVEVDTPQLSDRQLQAAEEQANSVVCRNLPVRVHWVSREQASRFALRRPPPANVEPLRIVEVEGLDASACGGLHVGSSGEVGLIKLGSVEKIRGRLRLYWLIGARAYRDTREKDSLAAVLGRELSCGAGELLPAVQELRNRLKAREAAVSSLERRLAAATAQSLLARAESLPGGKHLVVQSFEGENPSLLQRLVQELLEQPGTALCVGSSSGAEVSWWVGHSSDLALPLERLVPPALAAIEGRGGGRRGRWQGSGQRPEGLPDFLQTMGRSLRLCLNEGGGP